MNGALYYGKDGIIMVTGILALHLNLILHLKAIIDEDG
jgi:hypothetical protein